MKLIDNWKHVLFTSSNVAVLAFFILSIGAEFWLSSYGYIPTLPHWANSLICAGVAALAIIARIVFQAAMQKAVQEVEHEAGGDAD